MQIIEKNKSFLARLRRELDFLKQRCLYTADPRESFRATWRENAEEVFIEVE